MSKLELVQTWQAEIPTEQAARIGYDGSGIFRLQLTPDDRYAVTLNYQYRELIVWDFATGQRVSRHDWRGYDKVRDLYLTPDGKYAVVIGETGGDLIGVAAHQGPVEARRDLSDEVRGEYRLVRLKHRAAFRSRAAT